MLNFNKTLVIFSSLLLLLACEKKDVDTLKAIDDSPVLVNSPVASPKARLSASATSKYAIYKAEYLTTANSGQAGRTVYFNNVGNKQLDEDFVPGLSLDGTNAISYYIDQTRPTEDVSVSVSTAALNRAMQTWEDVKCSDLGIYQIPSDPTLKTGFVSALFGFGGSLEYVADVVHAGWLPGPFFDLLAPDGSKFILGVTFTIIFTDANGNPIDTDNNGKIDVAWREIYYNDAFQWGNRTAIDIETVALHEAGHGLSQEHFGKAFADAGKGKLHFSPRAVMNAAYSGVQTQIQHTDLGGHCSNWANWPNN